MRGCGVPEASLNRLTLLFDPTKVRFLPEWVEWLIYVSAFLFIVGIASTISLKLKVMNKRS